MIDQYLHVVKPAGAAGPSPTPSGDLHSLIAEKPAGFAHIRVYAGNVQFSRSEEGLFPDRKAAQFFFDQYSTHQVTHLNWHAAADMVDFPRLAAIHDSFQLCHGGHR